VAEHVEALGAVVHAVGGDVGEDGAAGEGESFAFTDAGHGMVEREAADFRIEGIEQGVEKGLDFGEGAGRVLFEARADGLAGEALGPDTHGAEHVDEGVVEGARAHFEGLVELFAGERGAGAEDLAGGPAVVGEEDFERVAGGHEWDSGKA
jgi:hypothetical protein